MEMLINLPILRDQKAELKFELQLFASRACTINYWTVSKHKMNWKVYSFLMEVL